MLSVSHKIKVTVTAECFPVDRGVAEHNCLRQCPTPRTGVVYNRVVIQRLLIIKLSSILTFPQSSHLQHRCHVFTTKGSVIFLCMQDMFEAGQVIRGWAIERTLRESGGIPSPIAYGPDVDKRDIKSK